MVHCTYDELIASDHETISVFRQCDLLGLARISRAKVVRPVGFKTSV